MPIKGWGDSIVAGLRGAAWKEKVASIEGIGQGVQSGARIHPMVSCTWYLVYTYARGPAGR